jgi:hypothetical protein
MGQSQAKLEFQAPLSIDHITKNDKVNKKNILSHNGEPAKKVDRTKVVAKRGGSALEMMEDLDPENDDEEQDKIDDLELGRRPKNKKKKKKKVQDSSESDSLSSRSDKHEDSKMEESSQFRESNLQTKSLKRGYTIPLDSEDDIEKEIQE